MPPALADDAAPEFAHLFGITLHELFDGRDALALEALHHLRADAGEFLRGEVFEGRGDIAIIEDGEAIGLEHIGAEFGEGAIGGNTYGAAHGFAAVFGDLGLDGRGELFGGCTRALGAVELATDFVDGVDAIDGDVFVDGGEDAMVHAHVKARAGIDDDEVGAEALAFAHAGAGFDAE